MKTGFHDPIQAKPKSGKKVKTPWDFEAPSYDGRNRVCAGTDYGIGYRNPVGHSGAPKEVSPSLPKGRVATMNIYQPDENIEVK